MRGNMDTSSGCFLLFLKHLCPRFYQLEFVQLDKQLQTVLLLSRRKNRHDQHTSLCAVYISACGVKEFP